MNRVLAWLCSLTMLLTACMAAACSGEAAPPTVDTAALDAAIADIEADELTEADIDEIVQQGEGMFWALRDHAFSGEELPQPGHYFSVLTAFEDDTDYPMLTEGLSGDQILAALRMLCRAGSDEYQDYILLTLPVFFGLVEEDPGLWDPFFADVELNENLVNTIENTKHSGTNEHARMCPRYLFLAVEAGAVNEEVVERVFSLYSDDEFCIDLLAKVTTPEQYYIAEAAALKLIDSDSKLIFSCIQRLQEIADGNAESQFVAEQISMFRNYDSETPSFAQGGTTPVDTGAAVAVKGSYVDGVFAVSGVPNRYWHFGQLDIENIHRMPTSPEEISVFICISDEEEQSSTYVAANDPSTTAPGMRYVVTVRLANAQEGQIYAELPTIYGADPNLPEFTGGSNSSLLGEYPEDAVDEAVRAVQGF